MPESGSRTIWSITSARQSGPLSLGTRSSRWRWSSCIGRLGDAKYLDFTRYLFSGVEQDRLKLKDADIRYMFSGKPFTSHTEFEGHAVRALYAASGATDYFAEVGRPGI